MKKLRNKSPLLLQGTYITLGQKCTCEVVMHFRLKRVEKGESQKLPMGMMKATQRNCPRKARLTSYRKSLKVVPKCLKTSPNSANVRLKTS